MLHMCVSVAEKIKKATQTKQRENGGDRMRGRRRGKRSCKKKKKTREEIGMRGAF